MAVEPLLAAKRATDRAERHRTAIESIRSRTDLSAKGLAVVGTAAVSAVGYAELADVFPYGGPWWGAPLLVAGVVGMVAAFVCLSKRFSSASEVIPTTVDPEETIALNKLDAREEEIVRSAYKGMADLNDVESLPAFQARAHRFERIAERLGPDDNLVDPLRANADLVMSEIQAVQARVGALILKKRAKEATSGWRTVSLVFLFIASWYLTALAADKIESERTEKIEVAKACADAREADAIGLPSICGPAPEGKEEETVSSADSVDDAIIELAKSRKTCFKAVAKAREDPSRCVPLQAALAALNGEGER
ncbi:MAG TPA: hypothetical protein VGV69_06765 [Solirubrobacterales bacterium]|nr:hypothetical protein [Solirubrobacterales bacterium]